MGLLDNINPISWISDGIKAIGGIIDNVSTTDEERGQLKNALAVVENQMKAKVLEYETKISEFRSNIIIAEAQSKSWMTSNWRPITMLSFVAIIINNYIIAPYTDALLGWEVVLQMPDFLWETIKIGLGGYIIGRSGEKITKLWKAK